MHELRRPLQALALAGSEGPAPARIDLSVQMAASALERLDWEINGGPVASALEPVAVADLLEAAVLRWRARAEAAGGSLTLRLPADVAEAETGDGLVQVDRWAIAQALDNLIVNAIEHGGPRIVVGATAPWGRLRILIKDCGRPLASPDPPPGRRGTGLGNRLAGRARHGHGLRVVRRVARAHSGDFSLSCSAGGAEAIFELPRAAPA